MKNIRLGKSELLVPNIAIGCMRLSALDRKKADDFVLNAVDHGAVFFDHADIYGGGQCETIFGNVLHDHPGLRDKMFIQSKTGIVPGKMYDLSKDYILRSTDQILERLQTDHLDMLLLHRPDALLEPEEIACAFDTLKNSGKVLNFGVSNMNSMQMELLRKYVKQPLLADQLQLSIPVSNMISSGMEVNMTSEGSYDHDGSVLDYCRLNDITIQVWSPFQKANWTGIFFNDPEYQKLNDTLAEIAEKYNATPTQIATAWILRHPAGMQMISGSMSIERSNEIFAASSLEITREEWYRIYLSAGHILP